jgi:hypothetical protein
MTPVPWIACVCAWCFFAPTSHAQETVAVRYAAELDNIPGSCRAAAMGDAGVALPLDAAGVFWNPAAHAFLAAYEISAEYARLYDGLSNQGCVALHVPLQERVSIDAYYTRFQSGTIYQWDTLPGTELQRLSDPSMRADGSYLGTFANDQNLLVLSVARVFSIPVPRLTSYSYPLPFEISGGLGFKGFWQTMNPAGKVRMGMNINCDGGVLLRVGLDYDLLKKRVSREILAGLDVRNFLGTRMMWLHSPDGYQESVDMSECIGVSYIDRTRVLGATWILSLAARRDYGTTYHGGIEAQFADMISFRVGMSDRVFTCGAGITYKNYSIDYAYRFDEVAPSPVRLSLRVAF